MLLSLFPALKENKFIKLINSFLASKWYVILVGLLVLLSHTFSLETYIFIAFVLSGVVIPCLLCEDMIAMVAPLAMTYSSISLKSNNTRYKTSLFSGPTKIIIIVLAVIILACVLARLIFDLVKNKEKRFKPRLMLGFLFLAPCYLLGGFLSPYYDLNTVLYGGVNFLSISATYFILLYLVDWKKAGKSYIFWVLTVYGLVVSLEVFYIIFKINAGIKDYVSWWDQIFTGWGMRNNIAGQIVLCIAAPIYLSFISSKKTSWIYLLFSPLMLVAIFLTNSRACSLFGTLIWAGCLVFYFIKCEKEKRNIGLVTMGLVMVAFAGVFVIKRDEVTKLLVRFFSESPDVTDINDFTQGRYSTWTHGLKHFSENELFGVGFYQCEDFRFTNFSSDFVPARYHNIYIQFLASTGIAGLIAYLYHRFETFKLLTEKPSLEKSFIFISLFTIVLCSLVDNNFFNLGPGLNYGIGLAFLEGLHIRNLTYSQHEQSK